MLLRNWQVSFKLGSCLDPDNEVIIVVIRLSYIDQQLDTADTDLLKIVPVEMLLNFGNYFRTLQLGFENSFQELCFFIAIRIISTHYRTFIFTGPFDLTKAQSL